MIDGMYYMEVDTPLGRKTATVNIETQGSALSVRVDAPIIGTQHAQGTVDGSSFKADGTVKIPLRGEIDFSVVGTVNDDETLVAQLKSKKGDLQLIGVRI